MKQPCIWNKYVTFVLSNESSLKLLFNERFTSMKFSELYRLLEKEGWVLKQGKKHAKYVKAGFPPVPVGRHQSKEVPTGTLNTILKEAGLK